MKYINIDILANDFGRTYPDLTKMFRIGIGSNIMTGNSLYEWIENHCQGYWTFNDLNINKHYFLFELESDAVLFKIAWS